MTNPMPRRAFLRSALTTSALVATSKLPLLADDPTVFTQRVHNKRVSLAYSHIEVGATQPFSILHLTDTHHTRFYRLSQEPAATQGDHRRPSTHRGTGALLPHRCAVRDRR